MSTQMQVKIVNTSVNWTMNYPASNLLCYMCAYGVNRVHKQPEELKKLDSACN